MPVEDAQWLQGRRSGLGPLDGGLAALRPPSVDLVAYGDEHDGLHGLPGQGGLELDRELHVLGNFSQIQSNHPLSLARGVDRRTAFRSGGNLIGGVATQTLVLAIADRFVRGDRPLTAAANSLVPALEGMLVIAVGAVAIMSGFLPESAAIGSLAVGSIAGTMTEAGDT